MREIKNNLKEQLKDNIEVHLSILDLSEKILNIIKILQKKLKKGGKLLFCGNGGSAADAQHLLQSF